MKRTATTTTGPQEALRRLVAERAAAKVAERVATSTLVARAVVKEILRVQRRTRRVKLLPT